MKRNKARVKLTERDPRVCLHVFHLKQAFEQNLGTEEDFFVGQFVRFEVPTVESTYQAFASLWGDLDRGPKRCNK